MNEYFKLINKSKTRSFYIYEQDVFKNEWKKLINSFKKQYKNTQIAYSFKTNYVPELLSDVIELGGYAEVVSYMELELALNVGFKHEEIFFNGPYKPIFILKYCLENDVLINIDNEEEFDKILYLSKSIGKKVRLGIRLNFESNKYNSRFGIAVKSNTLQRILKKIKSSQFINLVSLHSHLAPRNLKKWQFLSNSMHEFFETLEPSIQRGIHYISLGGGIFSNMSNTLREKIGIPKLEFDDYAKSILDFGNYLTAKNDGRIKLIIEPGTAVSSKCFSFITEIQSIKKIQNNLIINVSGSIYNLNPAAKRLNFDYSILANPNNNNKSKQIVSSASVTGYTCIESDILLTNFNGQINCGDLIVFKEIGSYSIVMKPPFILPACSIYRVDEDKKIDLIRKEEKPKDIFKNYQF